MCAARPSVRGFRSATSLVPFVPPVWAARLPAPATTLNAAMLPTPLHEWRLSELPRLAPPPGFALGIKRDDLTGSTLSGNKVRKLNFLLADALSRGCDTVITCGGVQSNHARATAVLARELGMQTHLFLRSKNPLPSGEEVRSNYLLSLLVGAKPHIVPPLPYADGLRPRMLALQAELEVSGSRCYHIPIGGSDTVGLWGYLTGFQELIEQDSEITDVVLSCGSGGTACGVALANYLMGTKVKIHAVSVCDDEHYFHDHVDATLSEVGVHEVCSRDILNVIDGFKGRGYALSTKDELTLLTDIARVSGVVLDPVYTVKGAHGLLTVMHDRPEMFNGRRIVFLHTGGMQGVFEGRMGVHVGLESDSAGPGTAEY